jgi:hypothetical protein
VCPPCGWDDAPPDALPDELPDALPDALLDGFDALLGSVSPLLRWSVLSTLVAFDQGARCYPQARGRRFTRLPDAEAAAYVRAALAVRRGGLGTALQRVKGLLVFCYYELPEAREQLGYRPEAYIAAVSKRRLASYGPQIRAAEAAVLADAGPRPQPDTAAP